MSEIVIRHIEARDAEALRDIMSHPGVYHDTLQLPHPSMDMWHDRVATKPEDGISSPVWTSEWLAIWHSM